MSDTLAALLAAVLLLAASFYLGTAWSIILFQYRTTGSASGAKNFADSFIAPVKTAIRTFTILSTVMIAGGIGLAIMEWDTQRKWLPVGYAITVAAAATYTIRIMFPINHKLTDNPNDEEFKRLVALWKRRHIVRAFIWSSEWFYIAAWFVILAGRGR